MKHVDRLRRAWLPAVACGALAIAVAVRAESPAPTPATAVAEPRSAGGPAVVRRLSENQYVNSIHNIFGADIKVPGRFDPELRLGGLLAIGDGRSALSDAAFEQDERRAAQLSDQILAPDRIAKVTGCASVAAFDRACAQHFFADYGRLLFRRPLTPAELNTVLAVTQAGTTTTNFTGGLRLGLARLLLSPYFIFRVERSEPDPAVHGAFRLDDYSLATRISFLLWDAPPDKQLLDAVAAGAMRDPAKVDAEVDRMMASPRFVDGTRAFFSDMLAYEGFDGLTKDQAIYPKYTSQMAADAREQALRTIVDLLVTRKGDYRDLFTTRKTFMNRNLASLYQVPIVNDGMTGWVPYTFSDSDHREGLLSLAGFLMLDPTHEGRSSPTIRGKTVHELLLCQPIPAPPANVNFSIVQNTGDPLHRTARERLAAHADNPACAGCHKMMDPIGLSMENYDAIGAWRSNENGAKIDASGQLNGKTYTDYSSFAQTMHDSRQVSACLTQRAYEYGVGRPAAEGEAAWLDWSVQRFAADGYVYPNLIRRIATSAAFRTVSAPEPVKAPAAHSTMNDTKSRNGSAGA